MATIQTGAEGSASAASPLLAAKFAPPTVRTPVIPRPRLLEQLERGVQGALTVVTGAAGAGKSLLVATWVARSAAPGPVAWLTLEVADDQPGSFWAYVVTALRRAGVSFPEDVGQPMRADHVDRTLLARVAEAVASRPQPVVLVLDQFDVVTDEEIKHGIDFVLRNAAPMLRLLLVGRDATPIPLHHYELRGELTLVDGSALAFTPDEAEALLRQHGVRLPPSTLERLLEQVGGWAAALRLSAVAMQRLVHPEDFVATLPASDRMLTDYLVDEVLGAQSEEVRGFLLRTAIVESICPDLADVLTGRRDSHLILSALDTGNVLTERLEQAPGWYRYHPLFRQLLCAELERTDPDAVPDVHRRAAAWFEQNGMTTEAVAAAAAGGDWQRATHALVRGLSVGALLAGREAGRLDAVFADLPADEPGPMAAVVRAARAMARFDLAACREQLRLIQDGSVDDGDDAAALCACAAVVRVVLARAEGDVDAAEAALADGERPLARLPAAAARHPELLALLLSNAGTAQLWAGRFAAAEETLRRGLSASQLPGCEYPRLNILGRLAGLEFRNGRLRRAARLGQEALYLAEEFGLPVEQRTGAGHVVLAMVAVEWNDRAAARRHLDDAERSLGARHDPFVATIVPLLRAWLHAGSRDFRRAFTALSQVPAAVAGTPLPEWMADRVAFTEAFIHLGQGHPDRAAAVLDRVADRGPQWSVAAASVAVARHDLRRARDLLEPVLHDGLPVVDAGRIPAWLLTARLAVAERNRPAAREAVAEALTLARTEGYRRAFADAGPWLRNLLRAEPDLARQHRWLGAPLIDPAVVGEGVAAADDPPAVVVERLTERERAVLQHLAQGLSGEDIARELYVSINTVKTHQKNLYRKLGVARRNEAVRRARQLHLI